uniref:Uncharacterized protein n=1 Tax=Podarcis muralis TaxID=64176 RepID=A0A670JIZ6_PODMU
CGKAVASPQHYFELVTTKNVVSAATGAGAIFLLGKTIMAGIKSPPYNPEPLTLARESCNAPSTAVFTGPGLTLNNHLSICLSHLYPSSSWSSK